MVDSVNASSGVALTSVQCDEQFSMYEYEHEHEHL